MAATEDKTHRGALIAAPSMPWVWGDIAGYSGPYHLVWSRDAYQVATALLAAGDRGAAARAVDYLWGAQQKPDGCFPQNSNLDGSPHWPNLQLDEVADPIVLSWQLRRFDAGTYATSRRRRSASSPTAPPRRSAGRTPRATRRRRSPPRSPASSAPPTSRKRNGDAASAERWLGVADDWQRSVDGWTLTRTGPLSADPYYLRLTVDGQPDARHDVHDRRRRPDDRPARRRRPELPRARAARGQGARRRRDPLVAAGRRPRARRRHAQRPLLASLQPRRLRRDARRRPVPRRRQHRPAVADLRRRARRVRARRRRSGRGARPAALDRGDREQRAAAARAGVG